MTKNRRTGRSLGMAACALTAIAIFLNGCASQSQWQAVQGPTQTTYCSIQMPDGWLRIPTSEFEMVTRDGPFLQYIMLQEQPVTKGFKHTNRTLRSDMLVHELAEVFVDNLKSDPAVRQFQLIASEPVLFAGNDGVKLVFSYQNEHAVDMQTVCYGAIRNSTLITLRFNAVQRHHFDTHLPTFEMALATLRFTKN